MSDFYPPTDYPDDDQASPAAESEQPEEDATFQPPPAGGTPREVVEAEPQVGPGHTVVFEDLTLAQALTYLFWRPVQTARLFWRVLTRDPDREAGHAPGLERRAGRPIPDQDVFEREEIVRAGPVAGEPVAVAEMVALPERESEPGAEGVKSIGLWIAALAGSILLTLRGGYLLHRAAIDPLMHVREKTNGAALWFVLAGTLYVGFVLWWNRAWWVQHLPGPAGWLRRRFHANDLRPLWNGALVVPLVTAIVLAATGLVGRWESAGLLALAGGLWMALLLGNTPAPSASPDLPVEEGTASRLPDLPQGAAEAGAVHVVRSVRRTESGVSGAQGRGFSAWFQANFYQLMLVPVALLLSALTYALNVALDPAGRVNDIVITTGGGIAWLLSVVAWATIFAVDVRRLPEKVRGLGRAGQWRSRWRVRVGWPVVALVGVTILGAVFRLHDLASTPPEMTSDHIEKLLDSLHVSQGYRGIFFPNNGGREGFQMYLVAFVGKTLGVGFNFTALKVATVAEGLVTLPVLWWMARQVIGTDTGQDRQLGTWVGVALAGLVAISSWHVMLSRLGLRIVLTPLATALVIGFLARAMHHNRMRDYVALGVVLGAGIYFYQADRMLPILVVIGIGLVLLGGIRRPRDLAGRAAEVVGFSALVLTPLLVVWYAGQVLEQSTFSNVHELGQRLSSALFLVAMAWFGILTLAVRPRRTDCLLQYGGGLLATAVVALAVYIPMYHYSQVRPDDFWNRTRGRIFGEEAFWRTDPVTGQVVTYEPTLSEEVRLFWGKRDIFVNNYRNALEMFHWLGDNAWINDAHGYPALDAMAGGLLILGLAVWGLWAAARRDPVIWLLPAGVLVMLLPSAMTLAYTIENPSFTRTSGAIPEVYMLAALPVGLLCWRMSRLPWRVWRIPVGAIAVLVMLAGLLGYGVGMDWHYFFTDYHFSYIYSWKPYHEIAQPLREFAHGEGSFGNAFMVAWPHWLDHRILGTVAGDIGWPNGLVTREDLIPTIDRNQGTRYQYDPTKPLFVMFHVDDTETMTYLQALFPGGSLSLYQYSYETEPGVFTQGSFYIYEVQAGSSPAQ
jgi:hypothetical protein